MLAGNVVFFPCLVFAKWLSFFLSSQIYPHTGLVRLAFPCMLFRGIPWVSNVRLQLSKLLFPLAIR